jgi:hypothetical protein
MERTTDFFDIVWANTKASDPEHYHVNDLVIHREHPSVCFRIANCLPDGMLKLDYGDTDGNMLEEIQSNVVLLSNFILIRTSLSANDSNTEMSHPVRPGNELISLLKKLRK